GDPTKILHVFNELTDVQRYWVQVTLNSPKCANVVISPDQTQVRYASSDQGYNAYLNYNYETFGVLGSPVITSGRHYWEVDVSKKSAWILGVCGNGNYPIGFSGYKPKNRNCGNCHNVYSRYQPKNGYWVIGLKHDSVYNAFESSFSGPVILSLSLSVSPHRVGVFLDYEAHTVLFLNVTNHGFPIYTFSSCSFPQDIVPYFNPMNCGAPMTLFSPSR
uniref:B30.2/SPRY domain-containing protein n=1 Tax=Bos indicus x Bos taurus TaxID=30522 RepID=A0A4W2HBW7_BOBOX